MKKDKINDLNHSKIPIVVFDKELAQLQDAILFPEKLKKANDLLTKVGLPKSF